MTLGSYLMIALVIAACIPVVQMIVNWYFLRSGSGLPWKQPLFAAVVPQVPGEPPPATGGARTHAAPEWMKMDLSSMPAQAQARMKELAIGFDGRQYTFRDYRYDRLSDAINYAELTRSRESVSPRH